MTIRVTSGRGIVHLDVTKPSGREARPDLVDRPGVLELLEGRAGRQPERHRAPGHRGERSPRGAATRAPRPRRPRRSGPRRQARPRRRIGHRTCAGIRAGSPSARAGPAGPSAAEGRVRPPGSARLVSPRNKRGPRRARRSPPGRPCPASRTPASSNSSRIAARYAASATSGARSPPSAAAASVGDRTDRAREQRIRVSRVDAAAGKDVGIGGERHRRGPMGQQRLEPVGPGPQQDDGRRRAWRDRVSAHRPSPNRRTNDQSHASGRYSQSRAGSRWNPSDPYNRWATVIDGSV